MGAKIEQKGQGDRLVANSYERQAFCHDNRWNYVRRDGIGFEIPKAKLDAYLADTEPDELEIQRTRASES